MALLEIYGKEKIPMKNILDKNMFFAGLKAVILAKFGE